MVSFHAGARTSAYIYRRYTDVRLVAAPELSVGFFGGDPDNFTYPRYTLDFAFLRVYGDDDEPLSSDAHFRWSPSGAMDGELTFVLGNPGSTARSETVAQLLFRRDVSDRAILDFTSRRAAVFEAFARANPDQVERLGIANTLFELQNTRKSYEGQVSLLHDPLVLQRLRAGEQAWERAVQADSVLAAAHGNLVARMAEVQDRMRQQAGGWGAFLALTSDEYESATLRRALAAYQYANALRQAQPLAVRNELRAAALAIANQPAELDEALMQERFRAFVEGYGLDSELVRAVLDGRSAEGAASFLRQNSLLADSARAAAAIESGDIPQDDPAMRVVLAYVPALSRFEQARQQLAQQQAALAEQIERARFAVTGASVPPDATFTLRLADGVVGGFPHNGSVAPAFTTFYGLYDRHHGHGADGAAAADSPWSLPASWRAPIPELDLSTPLNFVSSADIVGGTSGSAVVNRALEIVGVVFDGNQASLSSNYLFRPESSRAISVDVRAILVALDVVYGMEALVEELTTGRLAPAGNAAGTP
jgi:hypothetical protein